MRRFLLGLALLLTASVLLGGESSAPSSERETWNQPVPEWREGPVRYALTDEETLEYRFLATAAERASFIARFWAAREPSPFTTRNEAEETFWQRVSAADELFTQTTVSGWRTDRGRVYIVLGPPDEITNYPVPSVDEMDLSHFPDQFRRWPATDLRPGHRGAVEWVYRSLKSPRADAGQKITFTRDETGEYWLSGQLASTFRFESTLGGPSMNEALQAMSGGGRRGNVFMQATASFQEAMDSTEEMFAFGQAALFEKVENRGGPIERVTTAQFFGVIPIQNRIDFFRGTGGTAALITLGIPADDLKTAEDVKKQLEIFGRLEKVGDPSHVYQFSTAREAAETVPLQDVGGREHRLYEVRGVMPPGEYQVSFGVRIGDRIGAVGNRVEVPSFGGEALQISGPILADQIGERSSTNGPEGFSFGRLRLLPKLEPAFRPESDFGFYFQVYHAVPGSADGRLHLDIEYSVSAREKGLFVPLGKPVSLVDNSAPAHGFIIPLKGWNPGEYLPAVTVTDRVTLQVRAGNASFLVQ